MSTGKRGAEGQGWASTGSSISPCDAVCSCLISCTRHSGSFPGSGRSGGSRAPFQTQHPLQPGFENQLSLPSFRCLRRAFPSRPERWEHQDVDGKTHPANTRLPEETPHPSRELRSHRRSKKGLTPPCCSPTTIQPRGCRTLQPLKPLFSISYHPPSAGWLGAGLGTLWAGGSPARAAPARLPGHAASPQCWLRPGGTGRFFARFGRVSQRLSAGVPTAFRSCSGAGPARQTYSVRGEEGAHSSQGSFGTRPPNLASKGRGQGHTCARWQSRVQLPALPGAGVEQERCPDIPAHCQQGKPWGVTEPDTIRILPKALPCSQTRNST